MPAVTEQDPLLSPNQSELDRSVNLRPAISQVALSGVGISAEHFYGGENHLLGRTFEGEHRVLITQPTEEGGTRNEVVGVGKDAEAALHDSLEKMRTLETVHTRSLAQIEMTASTFVSFSKLEHYNPKVAPSKDKYPVPSYLEATLEDSGSGDHTYRNTVEREGWQNELGSIVANYLASDPSGQQLAASLKIRSLSHLTPEQAVKLSAAFVQNVSKYSDSDMGSKELTRADKSTAPELLEEGIANKRNLNWAGNGVCRNVASNVKAVFEALKQTQAELSMLNNTYCVYGAGTDGAGYADSRADTNKTSIGDRSGHAWNTFVTIDAEGSAVTTIIDATWALGKDASSAMQHLDRTEIRAASQLMQLFEKSEVKTEAFHSLTAYVQRLIRSTYTNPQISQSAREGVREYATTEYLRAAAQLPEIPEGAYMPDSVVATAYRMRGKLEAQEVAALFTLDKSAGGLERERIKAILAGFDGKREVPIPGWKSAENLIFADQDLQEMAYEAVGAERVTQLAEQSGRFRAKLRELHPEALPPFSAVERQTDAQELSYFAEQNGIHERDPDRIMKQLNRTLKRLVGDDGIFEAIVAGRTDYDLAKNFKNITNALRQRTVK